MKNPWEWTENDLLDMVKTGTQESIELDFKDSRALVNVKGNKDVRYEISKDVSALANAAGGTLIYGIVEDKTTHIAASLDVGVDPTVVTKEWLQQIINSTIHRKIDEIRINQIALTTHSPGNVAYVVYVPQSMRTPHQALDKKFYKRHEYESVAMEEYEIRDLYRRGETPDLRIEFMIPKPNEELVFNAGVSVSEPFPLGMTIINDALEPANYAVIEIYIDVRLILADAGSLIVKNNLLLRVGVKEFPVTFLQQNWGIPGKLPIFNDQPFSVSDQGHLTLKSPTDGRMGKHAYYLLGYKISSPRMPMKCSFSLLKVISGRVSLSENYLSPEELLSNHDKLGL